MKTSNTVLSALSCLSIMAVCAGSLTAQQPGAASQPEGIQGSFVRDIDNLSEKFTGLAQAMAANYEWRPMEGVRSVSDVFNLMVMENRMLLRTLSGEQGPGERPEPITDPAQMVETLRSSYADLHEAVAGMSTSELSETVLLFRRETTKMGALYMMLTDQHEHLGQSIAYARTNHVVPPWSRQGGM